MRGIFLAIGLRDQSIDRARGASASESASESKARRDPI
jgi:hypothetical protein